MNGCSRPKDCLLSASMAGQRDTQPRPHQSTEYSPTVKDGTSGQDSAFLEPNETSASSSPFLCSFHDKIDALAPLLDACSISWEKGK